MKTFIQSGNIQVSLDFEAPLFIFSETLYNSVNLVDIISSSCCYYNFLYLRVSIF